MNWREEFFDLERKKDWENAIIFIEKVIAERKDEIDPYLYIQFLLMNILINEYFDEKNYENYIFLLRKYFNEGYQKFSENAEFLFYSAYIATFYQDYYGEDFLTGDMFEKAIKIEPLNLIYRW